jgi:uncharacterized protein (TIGR02145 family)
MKHLFIIFLFTVTGLYPSLLSGQTGSFTDSRDGKVYKTIEINGTTWMVENLRYETKESKALRVKKNKYVSNYKGGFGGAPECGTVDDYGTKAIQCEHLKVVGRYYEWEDAYTACPEGWHLSTHEEWLQLFAYVSEKFGPFDKSKKSGSGTVTYYKVAPFLKSQYWNTSVKLEDPLGFSMMPDGYGKYDRISLLGTTAEFWTSTPLIYKSGKQANGYYKMIKASLTSDAVTVEDGIASNNRSVRCVRDE